MRKGALLVQNNEPNKYLSIDIYQVSLGLMMSNNRNFGGKTYVKYDYVYTKLSKNLDKEVSRQD